jgi:hypothetical protein
VMHRFLNDSFPATLLSAIPAIEFSHPSSVRSLPLSPA